MDKFVIRSKRGQPSSNATIPLVASSTPSEVQRDTTPSNIDFTYLKAGPEERRPIVEYDANIRDEVRRYYTQKGSCQPKDHNFPKTQFGKKKITMRKFYPNWLKGPYSKWLEYSVSIDAAYCLCCYLFKNEHEVRGNMANIAFTQNGFKGWNKALERFGTHIREVNSIHNKCLNMMNQLQSIHTSFDKHSEKEKNESRCRLSASIDVARFLLRLGLSFRGHDESVSSTNRGIFLELLRWYGNINEDVGSIILENAPKNEIMCYAKETIKVTMEDLDGDYFGILVDESKDISHKEQMTLVLRYVDKKGKVIERFVGVVHLQLTLVALVKKNSDVDDFFLFN
ncbi:zinc finger MYM-type protein 1-like [Capsicum annuum]|uniref:zinc finger MYM-type protein 1-like n=1 Tax=Capsicum annuum TaxID=4072 RepID=UPI001FB191BF|nr:zinc finger MYM-type protein 1-like [Capsicum annuum]